MRWLSLILGTHMVGGEEGPPSLLQGLIQAAHLGNVYKALGASPGQSLSTAAVASALHFNA